MDCGKRSPDVTCISVLIYLRLVAFASLAFGIVGIIACLCCKDVDKKMNNKVFEPVVTG
jgi:hypothetical protein|tara:strand:- start:2860 stop:3036 length:177 start_codon:yes stop_codon:yes gene_type:complete